jgi:ribonuclease VapC
VFIDASVVVALLLREATAPTILRRLKAYESSALVTNVIAVWEIFAAIRSKRIGSFGAVEAIVAEAIASMEIETLPISLPDLSQALNAFDRYGRHRYPDPRERNKGLNIADCFHYASAKSLRIPIFTLDEGFTQTDLEVVGVD